MTSPVSPVLRVTALTHRGAVRESNEDALVIGAFTACGSDLPEPVVCQMSLSAPVLVAVADGMGGHAAGEVAAAHAVRVLATTSPCDSAGIDAALRQIDVDLLAMARVDADIAGLGTTVAGVIIQADRGLRFGVGDSRVYLAHGGYLAQVSTDDRGLSGGLTQCLGGRGDGSELRAAIEPLPWVGRLLLCSDGLSDYVEIDTMEELLNASTDSTQAVSSLWAAAMNASGADNITIALVEVVPPPSQDG